MPAGVGHEARGEALGEAPVGRPEAGADAGEHALHGLGERQRDGDGAHQRVVGLVEDRVEDGGVGDEAGLAVEPPGALLPRDARRVQGAAEVEEHDAGRPGDGNSRRHRCLRRVRAPRESAAHFR